MANKIVRTGSFGKEVKIDFYIDPRDNIGTTEYLHFTFYFKGRKPLPEQLVLLKNIENFKKQIEGKLYFLDEKDWKKPVLEDFLDEKTSISVYSLTLQDYSSEDYVAFFEKHSSKFFEFFEKFSKEFNLQDQKITGQLSVPELLQKFAVRIASKSKIDGIADFFGLIKSKKEYSISKLEDLLKENNHSKKIEFVLVNFVNLIEFFLRQEIELQYGLKEKNLISEAINSGPEKILELIKNSKNYRVKNELEKIFLKKISDSNNRVSQENIGLLKSLAKIDSIAVTYSNLRWTLKANLFKKQIDISKAKAKKADFVELMDALIVGNVSNNDTVLFVPAEEKFGQKPIFIKGGKSLKQDTKSNGGSLKKFDNILTIGEGTIYSDLLQVEKMCAIATLNPQEAIKLLKEQGVETKELEKLAPKIKENYLIARKFSDVAIELEYKMDPKITKKLIKSFNM